MKNAVMVKLVRLGFGLCLLLGIRKYFFRIWICGTAILKLGSRRPIDYDGSGSYQDIFVPNEKICCQIGKKS
jgi:hypothetical protein